MVIQRKLYLSRSRAVLLAGLIPLLLRAALFVKVPIPAPSIHDEFSYLLAADTFAHGRLTNPPHPLWPFFESIHILQQPTYMSMYPPMQGLILALGKLVFGHPFWGAYFFAGLMCALACWTLEALLPPVWALLGSMLIGIKYGVNWADSYWGGAAPTIGACLLLGSFLRLRKANLHPERHVTYGTLSGIGMAILANSRPWEGLVFSLPVSAGLILWIVRSPAKIRGLRLRQVALPCLVILLLTALGMAYYCWRVTGSPTTMPYTLNYKTYRVGPLFVWQARRPAPVYRHEVMKRFYLDWEPQFQHADEESSINGWLRVKTSFATLVVGLAMVLSTAFWKFSRMRFLAILLAVFLAGVAVERYTQTHYLGPILPAVCAVYVFVLRRIWRWRPRGRPVGRIAAGLVLLCVYGALAYSSARWIRWNLSLFGSRREALEHRLQAIPGRHLVIVRYAATHDVLEEWVYNAADIDAARVVWARDMGAPKNMALLEYYRGRKVWYLDADNNPAALSGEMNAISAR